MGCVRLVALLFVFPLMSLWEGEVLFDRCFSLETPGRRLGRRESGGGHVDIPGPRPTEATSVYGGSSLLEALVSAAQRQHSCKWLRCCAHFKTTVVEISQSKSACHEEKARDRTK